MEERRCGIVVESMALEQGSLGLNPNPDAAS